MPLQLHSTSTIVTLLERAGLTEGSSRDGCIEWRMVKEAAQILRDRGEEVTLKEACNGSSLVLKAPVKREVSPEFRKVLDECKRNADNAAYDRMVKDVVPEDARADVNGPILPTTKLQIGQGVHMAVAMGLGYALGSQFAGAIGSQLPILKPLGGVLGVIVALMLETVLFMARANMQTNDGLKYEHLFDPERARKKKLKPTPAGTPFTTQPKKNRKYVVADVVDIFVADEDSKKDQ